jgi:hypothetical protein
MSASGARATFASARREAEGGASPKSTVICAPMIGCTPAFANFSENSSAPNRLLVSVIANAGIESALASLAKASIDSAPWRSEKALWTRRWTKPTALTSDESMTTPAVAPIVPTLRPACRGRSKPPGGEPNQIEAASVLGRRKARQAGSRSGLRRPRLMRK